MKPQAKRCIYNNNICTEALLSPGDSLPHGLPAENHLITKDFNLELISPLLQARKLDSCFCQSDTNELLHKILAGRVLFLEIKTRRTIFHAGLNTLPAKHALNLFNKPEIEPEKFFIYFRDELKNLKRYATMAMSSSFTESSDSGNKLFFQKPRKTRISLNSRTGRTDRKGVSTTAEWFEAPCLPSRGHCRHPDTVSFNTRLRVIASRSSRLAALCSANLASHRVGSWVYCAALLRPRHLLHSSAISDVFQKTGSLIDERLRALNFTHADEMRVIVAVGRSSVLPIFNMTKRLVIDEILK
ncbi:hypothetical protein J6590_057284 [Homalodisca vitripennis]|nr:hypothetical protein J6590_057284 [Homalodisca vitripennis]